MKLRNMKNEIESASHESWRVTTKRKRKGDRVFASRDFLDSLILNVSIAIGICLVVAGTSAVAGGYVAQIPALLGF